MIPRFVIHLFLAVASIAGALCVAAAEPRTISLSGTLTNTTAEQSSPARLELTIDGETVTATLRVSPPLVGSGNLTGRLRDGWCELNGQLAEGLSVRFRGGLTPRDFRGTYSVKPEKGVTQYGSFDFSPLEKK